MTPRARVVPAAEARHARPLLEPRPGEGHRVRVAREEMQARLEAERVVGDARVQAAQLLASAREGASGVADLARSEARQEAQAEFTARWIALRVEERRRFERDADQVVPVAVALAERLLGASLELDPARIASLARAVLDEARGARRAVIDAHPLDADTLRQHLTTDGLDPQWVEVRSDASLARGELRLHTDMGTIDARLAPRFERLASALRDALRPEPSRS
jgi:flagellar assembly protein FliH